MGCCRIGGDSHSHRQPVQFITAGDYFYVDPIHSRKTESAEAGLRLFEKDLQEMMTYLCEYSRYAVCKAIAAGISYAARGDSRRRLWAVHGRRDTSGYGIPDVFLYPDSA